MKMVLKQYNMFKVLRKLESLLKEKFNSKIKTFVIGDPVLLPESSLPCLCVSPVSSAIDIADVCRDIATYTIEIIVIISLKNELEGRTNQIIGTEFLTEIMEQIDADGNLKDNTILKVLRENLRIEKNLEISNSSSITYTVEMRGDQFFTREARLRLTVNRILERK